MAFVMTQGQLNRTKPAIIAAPFPSAFRTPLRTTYSAEMLYRTQPAVRTVVDFIARNVAELGIDVFKRVSDTNRRKVRDHPLARLLSDPFPGSKWTQYRLVSWTVHELCIFDNAYWLKGRSDDGLPGVMPIPNNLIMPLGSNMMAPDAYRLLGSSSQVDLDPDQVVHFFGYNPDDPRLGLSPIETLRQILGEEMAATRYREQMWRNGARVGGFISRPKDAPRWSDGAKTRFRRDWQDQYSGDGLEVGGTPVLEDGMTYTPSGITPKDAQYTEGRQLTREEVCIAYHVNPAILGVVAGQSSNSVPEIRKQLYADSLGPWLELLQQDIEHQLLPDIDPAGVGSVYVEFNLRRKMQGSFEEQAAAISASVGAPWMTRAEARALNNLPEVDGADELIVPLNVTKGGLASPRDTAPDNPSNAESNGQLPGPKPAAVGA